MTCTTPNDPPPSYSSQTHSADTSGTRISSPRTYKTKPTNFLTLSTGDAIIHGEFVIDPSIRLPPSLLPPLGEGETEEDRKNLFLTSKYLVNADIWLLGSPSGESVTGVRKPQRTTIALASDHGSIYAELHALDGAAPFSLTARASQWTTSIALPRSFKGLLLLSTRNGGVTLSNPLLENVTQLSQLDTLRQYFVGDLWELGEEEWEGSRVEIEAPNGAIRVKYVDEEATAQVKKGFFSWLFGK